MSDVSDVIQCAGCGCRTTSEWCKSCVAKSAEVEQLAAQILPHLHSASMIWNAIQNANAGTYELDVHAAFRLAETFIKVRNERRRQK